MSSTTRRTALTLLTALLLLLPACGNVADDHTEVLAGSERAEGTHQAAGQPGPGQADATTPAALPDQHYLDLLATTPVGAAGGTAEPAGCRAPTTPAPC